MNKTLSLMAMAILTVVAWSLPAVANDLPTLVTFHSKVYDLAEDEEAIQFVLYADQESEVEIVTGSVDYTSTVPADLYGKTFTGVIGEDGMVTIKGDPAHIYGLDVTGAHIDYIYLGNWQNIEILNLSHNYLTEFDATPLTSLTYLNVTGNPFEPGKCVFADSYPKLAILEMAIIDDFGPTPPPLKGMPELLSFIAFSTYGFNSLDFSNCPKILQVSINNTSVTDLNIGPDNSQLRILNIGDLPWNYPGSFSDFPHLRELYVDHEVCAGNKLTEIDVTGNPELVYLFVSGNKLTDIDLSQNTNLMAFFATNNNLTSLDLTNNTSLIELMIQRNNLTFATLPDPSLYSRYEYSYQKPMQVNAEYKVGDVIDLSDKVLRDGSLTTCAVYKIDPAGVEDPVALTIGTDYDYSEGKVTLLRAQDAPIYALFANTMFISTSDTDEASIATTEFLVRSEEDYGKPTPRMTMTPTDAVSDFFVTVAPTNGGTVQGSLPPIYVDWGDGNVKTVAASDATTYNLSTAQATGNAATISLIPGYEITGISSQGNKLSTLDVTQLGDLTNLVVENADLPSIDLSYNNLLTNLSLAGNRLSKVDLNGATGGLEKNVLTAIDLSNNQISEFTWRLVNSCPYVNLSHNQISEFDPTNAAEESRIKNLDLSFNNFSELNLVGCVNMETLLVNGNRLKAITLPEESALTNLDIANNEFTFASLPKLSNIMTSGFNYAPQAPISIAVSGPSVDLSNQVFSQDYTGYNAEGNYVSGTFTTQFAWYRPDGTKLTEGVEYSIDNGLTTFINPDEIGTVYCVVSNGAYPQFSGENSLKTTEITPSSNPAALLASFHTTKAVTSHLILAGTGGTNIYIDWGDGELIGYPVQDNDSWPRVELTAKSLSGENDVKVYAYSDDVDLTVFSTGGIPMTNPDFSGMDNLYCLTLSDCGIPAIDMTKIPTSIHELTLSGNNLESIDLSRHSNLYMLALSNNKLADIDFTGQEGLGVLYMDNNLFEDLDLSPLKNVGLLSLAYNQLKEIDLTPMVQLNQANLIGNQLENLGDVTSISALMVLQVNANRLSFATLPLPQPNWMVYTYSNQATLTPPMINGDTVDLSSQALVGTTETLFYWFDAPYEIDDEGYVTPAPLEEGEDYEIEGGITTFHRAFDKIYGLLVNESLPNIYLNVEVDGSSAVGMLNADAMTVDVNGRQISVNRGAVVYDIAGRLVSESRTAATHTMPGAGVYVVRSADASRKVIVK